MSEIQHEEKTASILADSIRRAKQKINNHHKSIHSYHQPKFKKQSHNTQDRQTLAAAMKILHQKIALLEEQKRDLRGKDDSKELLRLVSSLRQKQNQILKLNGINRQLNERNKALRERINQLQEELYSKDQISELNTNQVKQRLQMNNRLNQLQLRNSINLETISRLMGELDNEKRTNLRWIKMHESQLSLLDEKENENLQNVKKNGRGQKQNDWKEQRQILRREREQLKRQNEEMFRSIQRQKQVVNDLSRQCKEGQEQYLRLRLCMNEMIQYVNRVLPNQTGHLKYLMVRLNKMQNNHLKSLRSLSRKKSEERSHSKGRRSLKMQDLNSTSKRSIGRSSNKSSKYSGNKSDRQVRKNAKIFEEAKLQMQVLQRQVMELKKNHRNRVSRSSEQMTTQEKQKMDHLVEEYNLKKERLEELRKLYGRVNVKMSNLR